MKLKQIGIIHSPYKEKSAAPPQGRMKEDTFEIEILSQFADGLKDIETATHLIILYWLDRAERDKLIANTPWDDEPHGVFATRSPARPNPIAFDIVDLVKREGNKLYVKGMDALDQSPLLDIKPYNSRTDAIPDAKLGWFEKAVTERNK
ncbi:MAG: hypothetical protein PWQ96_690 [Clostridia bacterium]|jgi:formylmethanofuran dehydrogenase subunit E|nr:putative methyltransferase, YaeB family [Clostridiales bacterium]MDK2985048.1 hypothetical protein [Clostridia bacterium]